MLPLTSGLGVAVPEHLGADLLTLSPAILVFLVAIVIILWEAVARPPDKRLLMGLSLVAVLVSLGLVTTVQAGAEGTGFSGMLAFDAYGTFFNLVFLISAGLSILISHDYLERIGLRVGEYYALALFSLSGMMLMGMGNDLILLFVALEVMSLGLYVMAAMQRTVRAVESGFKYFIMGAFASGILLYGIAFIYGDTGTTNLHGIRDAVAAGHTTGMLMIGVSLIMVGFCFKVAAVPFHMWAPDVYEGAPASVTGYMATGVKAASFAAFGRVLFVAFLDVKDDWTLPLWLIAAATMLLGNIAALVQVDLKRMLAYSSIAHAGYMLMALVAVDGSSAGANPQVSGLLFYLLAYTFMTLGAFAVLTLMAERGRDLTSVEHLVGLARRNPLLAAGLALCLLSLAGIPPTMGFVGKFYLFAAAVRGGYTGLAIVGAVSGAIGVYYYLRPIVYMYMRDDREPLAVQPGAAVASALGIASLAILAFGLFPGQLIDLCRQGVASLAG
ncbi:MAG: NADH-quinone oxidoreductase subunit N [Alphaproteobacteria bacterium]|nr:NADH-quinone oxidoreductase subunit N [Alphaproteobacteria bacterium]MCB9796379.1 NADH-quinone oxidoreductase subunit N [Alphaproteobacteria bacterium]